MSGIEPVRDFNQISLKMTDFVAQTQGLCFRD